MIAYQTVVQEYVTPTTETPTLPRAGLETYQPQNIKDRSLGFQVFRGTYTLDDLEQDKEFQLRSERFMESIKDDEDIFEYLRDSDFSLSSAFVRSGQVKGWSDQAKEDYNYLRQTFDNADIGSTKQYMQLAKDLTVDLVADPLNWLAAAFFVSSLSLAYLSSQQADIPDSLIETVVDNDAESGNDDGLVEIPQIVNEDDATLEIMPSIEAVEINTETEQ